MTVAVPSSELLFEIHDHVASLTLNREGQSNALNQALISRLRSAFTTIADDPDVWAVTITGAGERVFCAGGDLKEMNAIAEAGGRFPVPMTGDERNLHEVVLECPKPTIAVLNGSALAGGFELALACDLRVAAETAKLGMPEARRGMGANFATVLLPRLLPRAVALEMLYTAEPISAATARDWGLVNQVVPVSEVKAAGEALARRIVANAPLVLARYKQMTLKGWELPLPSALRLDVGPNPYLSRDREEGIRAFVEKREPQWEAR